MFFFIIVNTVIKVSEFLKGELHAFNCILILFFLKFLPKKRGVTANTVVHTHLIVIQVDATERLWNKDVLF